jgi:hypothetical protein
VELSVVASSGASFYRVPAGIREGGLEVQRAHGWPAHYRSRAIDALIGQDWLRPIPCRIMAPYFEQLQWVEELSLFR